MLQLAKSAIWSKAVAWVRRLSAAVGEAVEAADRGLRSGPFGIGARSTPALIPVRVKRRGGVR